MQGAIKCRRGLRLRTRHEPSWSPRSARSKQTKCSASSCKWRMVAPWLNDPEHVPYTNIRFVAVGIKKSGPSQMHMALLYEGADGVPRALHFCWHYAWQDEPAPPGYFWVQPAVRPSVARSL